MTNPLNLKIQAPLLQWFKKNKRPLPWRGSRDPYKIWISEMMLQQTQVNTVIPYYQRWMKSFPNVRALAHASLSRILKHWEGLGYYTRARNLHDAAKIIVEKFDSRLPDSREELEALPGIGRYTAGAVASIAFNKPEPILDGNVIRVLARVLALKELVDKTRGKNKLWEISRQLVEAVPASLVGDFNQSLMELGALVCFPENPRCSVCPLEMICEARRLGKEVNFPVKARRQKIEKLKTVAAVIWRKGRVLLKKQSPKERWGGLWIFPQWVYTNGTRERNFIRNKLKRDLGIRVENLKPRTELKHGFTKYTVRLRVYEGKALSSSSRLHWIEPKKLSRLALPSPHQKIARSIQDHG